MLKEFEQNKYADVITFMMEDENGNLFKDYTNISKHNKKSIREVNSVVIAITTELTSLILFLLCLLIFV